MSATQKHRPLRSRVKSGVRSADMASAARKLAKYHNNEVERRIANASAAGEEATRRIEYTHLKIAQGMAEFHLKVIAIAYANVDAALDFNRELLGVTSPSEFVELSTKHARRQFQAMSQQSRELVEIALKTAIESMGPLGSLVGGAVLGRPDLS